jgi:flagellar basal body-associated protein FliL
LSSKSEEELKDPLRAEKLRSEILLMANEKVLKRGRVIDVFITSMELE